jgi:peptidyl-prolyl cis-trans isomerase D
MAGFVLDELILRQALLRQAQTLGITVSDAELRQYVQTSFPFLYPGGQFVGLDRYRDFVSQQMGMSVAQFEAQLRHSLLQDKVRAAVTDGARLTPEEVREEFLRRHAKARVEYVLFDPSQLLKAVEVTPEALQAFFQKDPKRYEVPEQRRVRYVLIDQDRVRAGLKIGEEELKQYYGQHIAEYRVEERVRVAHILFKTEGKTPGEITTLEKTAQDVLAKIKAGADFAELARKFSEDASASKGGEIGWIVRGQTVKEFEDAAFRMNPGQVSDLIRTTYGIHIVKVLEKQAAHLQTFEEVKQQIREQMEKQRLVDAQQALANDFERQAKHAPQDFASLARQRGLEVKESPLFRYNQAVPDLGTTESFHNLAFQLRQGEVGIPVTVPKGLAVIQVAEIVPAHLPKFEEIRAAVEQDYRAAKSQDLAVEKAQEFAAQAKKGNFAKVAKAMGLSIKESKEFTQQDYVEGVGSGSQLSAAFTLPVGEASDAVAVGTNRVVFRVVARTPPQEADLPSQQMAIAEELLERKRAVAWEIYRQNLKQELLNSKQLKLNDAALKQFLASYQRAA